MNDVADALFQQYGRRLPPFPRHLGMTMTEATPDRLVAELVVRDDTSNGQGTMHGGALMAVADTMGAVGTILNLEKGFATTTLESKTNFIGAAPVGARLLAEAVPLHRGRTTQVWQTTIRREDGKTVAIVTQTQLVMAARVKAGKG